MPVTSPPSAAAHAPAAPPSASAPTLPPAALQRAQALLATGRRQLLGLVGAPGAGKSTLAQLLAEALNALQPGACVVVPMDGYHLANQVLAALDRAGRKGAPDTFDAAGYAALLQRLRQQRPGDATVYAPEYRREVEEAIANAIAVPAEVPLVITEGNYLLLAEGDWAAVAALLDDSWYLAGDDTLRTQRLLARHQRFGRSAQDAAAWVAGTDAPNALRIAATQPRARFTLRWGQS